MKKILTFLIIIVISSYWAISKAQIQLTNLPTIYLTTENKAPILNKELWIPGSVQVVSADTMQKLNMSMEIRGRGNSTWNLPKKPYRIKLNEKTRFLHLPAKEKNWVLLANHSDKSLIRNAIAFEISKFIGMEFTPSVCFADVYLNNNFIGNYMVTDQIERTGDRVPGEKQDSLSTTLPDISGGYLLEIDGFADSEPVKFYSDKGLKFTVKYPKDDEINKEQLAYITEFTRNFESVLFSASYKDPVTGYRSRVDTTSLINWYIASELTGNPDCFWSTYIYKKRNDNRFYFGPLWDYDIAFNNDFRITDKVADPVRALMKDVGFNPKAWINQFYTDEWFLLALNKRWKELVALGIEKHIKDYIAELSVSLDASQKKNFEKWQVLNRKVYNEPFLFNTYTEYITFLNNYISNRVAYLSETFQKMEPELPTPPFQTSDFYYSITNKRSYNRITVKNNSKNENEQLVTWAAVEGNKSQHWKIESLGNGEYRIVNRNSGLAITAVDGQNNLIQKAINNQNSYQKWKITPVKTGGLYGLENVASGKSANNSGGSLSNDNPVIQYNNNIAGSENQQWYIEPLEPLEGQGLSNSQIRSESAVNVFPNPASDNIYIQSTLDILSDVFIELYSIDGRCVWQSVSENQSGNFTIGIPVSTKNITSGIYIIKIKSNGFWTTKRIIVD